MSHMDMNQVDTHLEEILEKYTEESYLHRLKKLLLKKQKQKQKTRNNYLLRLCGSC